MRMEYIGSLLKLYREDTFLSRMGFALEHGICRSLIERIETGQNCNIHSYLRYMDLLQVPVSEIMSELE